MGPGTGSIEVDLAYPNVLTLISLYILVRWVYFYFYISSLGTHFGFSVHFGTLGLLLWIWTWDSLSLLCAFWYARFTSVVWSWDSLLLLCAFWYAGFTSTSIDLVLGLTLVSLYILVQNRTTLTFAQTEDSDWSVILASGYKFGTRATSSG